MRLIDADALEDVLVNHGFCYCGENEYNDGVADGFLLARDDVKQAPTIDAVEVVRCKDCRWFNDRLKRDGAEDNRYAPSICTLHGRPHSNTYFCANGEVKE